RFDRIDPNAPARMPNPFGEDRNGRWPDVDELADGPELLLAVQQRDEGFRPLCLLLGQGERGRRRPKRQDQHERDYSKMDRFRNHLMTVVSVTPSVTLRVRPSMRVN